MNKQKPNCDQEKLNDSSCSTLQWEVMKADLLSMVDEKFDIEATAQMVEQLEFAEKVNASLQQSFQSLQAELLQKDQIIQYLQGRLDSVELDIALLKRAIISYHSLPLPSGVQSHVAQRTSPSLTDVTESRKHSKPLQSTIGKANVHPPDFSKLRAMTVAEPAKKFIPPTKPEVEDAKNVGNT